MNFAPSWDLLEQVFNGHFFFIVILGKTTLLNVLYGRANMGVVTGDILLNNEPFKGTSQFSSNQPKSAYVMQDDAHLSILTVRETLTFAAMLRFRDSSFHSPDVSRAVSTTMELLGLSAIGDSYLGTSEDRTISLGQLRRVTIGVEIIHRPSLIFLDEPTSGLDSYLALTVVEGLYTLARSMRTICCTIHQPSKQVFEKFDKLLLLCNGYPIYFGPIVQCITHFENDKIFEYQKNPAEFILEIATTLSHQSVVDPNLLQSVADKSLVLTAKELLIFQSPASTSDLREHKINWVNEFKMCLQLVLILLLRDLVGILRRRFWIALSIRSLLFGVFLGFKFFVS